MIRILLLGGSGILGSEVLRQLQLMDADFLAPQSADVDVRDIDLLQNFAHNFKPNWIINCTAWTNVDGAEVEFEAALDLNEGAVRNIAQVAKQVGSYVIHISTDYVFDGNSLNPYDETAAVNPINNYGESKLRGERALLEVLPTMAYIIRTSWLYGVNGKNFVKSIATKAIRSEAAQVVSDQQGSPTSARDLAKAISAIVYNSPEAGIYNFSNQGSCSWFDLARTIYRELGADPELVQAITTTSLRLKAKRPKYSLLSKEKWEAAGLTGIPEWHLSLKFLLPEILANIRLTEKI